MATSPATEFQSAAGPSLDGILLAEELLDLAERAQAYTNAAGVAIALRRGQELLVRTSTGSAPEVGTLIPMSDNFIAECLRSRRPLCCRDAEADSRVGQVFRDMKIRSMIAVPMCEHREAKGVMMVLAPVPNAFQPTHTAILMTLSDIIASKLAAREAMPEFDAALIGGSEAPPAVIAQPAPTVAAPAPPATKPVVEPEVPKPSSKPAVASEAPKPAPKPPVISHPPMPARVEAVAPSLSEPVKPAAPSTAAAIPPALLRTVAMPLPEQKTDEREPGLLSPSEDPGRFAAERPIAHSSTITPRPGIVSINVRPSANIAVTPAVPASPVPAITAWEAPDTHASKRPMLMGAGAVAAVLVIVAGLWVYRTTSKEVSAPSAAVPAPVAMSLPPSTPAAAPTPAPAAGKVEPQSPLTILKREPLQILKPAEAAPAAEPKHQPRSAVIEIAAAQPKQAQEPDMQAPKLSLASNDAALSGLAKLPVAVPTRPPSELVPATLVSRVAPTYPQIARQMNIAGSVIMNVTISSQGTVSGVHVVSGPGQLRGAAAEAVRQWRYKPAVLNGKPVESSVEVQVNFAR